jgi:hypothetical protein
MTMYLQLYRNIFPFISKIFPTVLFTVHSDCLPVDLALLGRPKMRQQVLYFFKMECIVMIIASYSCTSVNI